MNWLYYLLEANLYLGVFYLAYCLFLNKETYYAFNRIYLIASCVIAFILPVLQVSSLKQYFTPDIQVVQAPLAVTPTYVVAPIPQMTYSLSTPSPQPVFTADDALYYGYWIGAAIVLILLITKLVSLFKLISSKPVLNHDSYKLIYLDDLNTAFSFFNYLFIGRRANNSPIIIRHELVHIRQKHSADIMFIEILKVINWFNPFIYLVQKSLKTVHEYIADQKSLADDTDTTTYSAFLVNNAYGLSGPSITHSFYTYNLLKNRIIMLHQKRSGSLARLKYLVAVPIGAGLLCASTMAFSKTYGWIDLSPKKPVQNKETFVEQPPTILEKPAYEDLFNHLQATLHFPASLKNKSMGIMATLSFELNNKGIIKNITIDNYKNSDIFKDVAKAFESYNKPIKDNFKGKRYMHINFATKKSPPPPPLDPKITNDPGYLGFYSINDEPSAKLEIINYPPPRVVPNNQLPAKRKTDMVRFPPPIVKPYYTPISERNFRAFTGLRDFLTKNIQYPDAAREKKISGVTTAKFDVDDNGYIIGSSIDLSGANDFNEVVLAGLNTYSSKIAAKKGSYNIVFTFRANKNDQLKFPPTTSSNGSFAGIINIATEKSLLVDVVRFPPPEPPKPKVDQIKFPPPVGELKVAAKRVYNPKTRKWTTVPTPLNPKVDQIKFPPPIVKPDKAGQLKRKELPPPPEPPKPKVADYKGPYFKTFDGLRAYLAKNIKYPKSAKEQDITKTVTATFNINAEGQISNPAISYNSGEYFDEEILKALNAYTNKIAVKADTYSMIFQFNIVKKNGPNKFPPPVVLTPGLAGVITITAYAE